MTNPIAKAVNAVGRVFEPLTTAASRAITIPGLTPASAPTINIPSPTESAPAKIPGSKPAGAGLRESFLSGVVGGAAGQGLQGGSWDWRGGGGGGTGSGGQKGKSLIGA